MKSLLEALFGRGWEWITNGSSEDKCFVVPLRLFGASPLKLLEPTIVVLDEESGVFEKIGWYQVAMSKEEVTNLDVSFSDDLGFEI